MLSEQILEDLRKKPIARIVELLDISVLQAIGFKRGNQ